MNKNKRSQVEQLIIENNVNVSDMYNKERKLTFIEETQMNANDTCTLSIIRKFNQFGKIENLIRDELNNKGKDLAEFNRENFKEFFGYFAWAKNSFSAAKSLIMSYLRWCCDKQITDNNVCSVLEDINYSIISHKAMFNKYYFRNLSELQETIENYRKKYASDSANLNFHIAEIAILLAWSGIKLKDVFELQEKDIDTQKGIVYIKSKKHYVILEPYVLQTIVNYIHSDEYIRDGDDNISRLIRPVRSTKISSAYLSVLVSRYFGDNKFNGLNELNGKIINYNKVYWSGIYSRARLKIGYEDFDVLDTQRMCEIFQEDYTKQKNPLTNIYLRKNEYRNYLEYMFGEELYKRD